MSLFERIKLYGFGFLMGLILVYLIFGFRACNNISDVKLYELSMQKMYVSENAKKILDSLHIPLHYLHITFKTGDWKINFDKSQTRIEPCKKYRIEPTEKCFFRFSMETEDCGDIFIIRTIEF